LSGLLVNIDVEDLEQASQFYCAALDLRVGRRFEGWIELVGAAAPIYLLPKAAGTAASPKSGERRHYGRQQAAWAASRPRYGLPEGVSPSEGWIVSALADSTGTSS